MKKVKIDELETIAGMCGVTKADAEYIVNVYPLGNGYFDRVICGCYNSADEFFKELAWEFSNQEWFIDFCGITMTMMNLKNILKLPKFLVQV